MLTHAYFESGFARAEWYSAFAKDAAGEARLLLPVRVQECDVEGLLGQIIYIDLAGLEEAQARERLLAGVRQARAKPSLPPRFPGLGLPAEFSKPAFPAPPRSQKALRPWRRRGMLPVNQREHGEEARWTR